MKQAYYSLKKRLLIWISISVLITGFLVALLSFLFSWHEIAEVYDAQMAHTARVLIDLTESDIQNTDYRLKHFRDSDFNIQHRYERKTGYRLWYHDQLIVESFRARDFGDFRAPEGFSDYKMKDKPWRFFVYTDAKRGMVVEVSQRYAIRYELINQLMLSLLIPAFLFIPIILGLIWYATSKSLEPLIQLSRAVDKRHSDDLTPIEDTRIPLEILPLVQALNRLFTRISDSFRREREFTDYAAHELRTPLAAMKTQTQVLMKKAAQMPECQDGLNNLHSTIDRATHLVEQLLLLARVQSENLTLEKMDLSECLRDVVDHSSRIALSKIQTIRTNIPDAVYIRGNPDSLPILLRNILDNALKYTPDGGAIDITLSSDATLTMKDTGPGLSDDNKAGIFGRFVRADKTGQTGSGLGLSIAQSIADTHGITIQLSDNNPQGLVVTIAFEKNS